MRTKLGRGLVLAPGVVAALAIAFGSRPGVVGALFALWMLVPFAALAVVAPVFRHPAPVVLAATLFSACAAVVLWEVFLAPSSSTSSLLLIFVPLWMLLLVGPVSLGIGTLGARALAKAQKR